MVYLNPRPVEEESQKYYQNEEYLPFSSTREDRSAVNRIYGRIRTINLHWKRRLVERFWRGGTARGPGTLLDVGCGTGEFLSTLGRAGWQVTGLERDATASSWARKTLGLTVYTGDLGALPADARGYDVITLWHVLEHLYDPIAAVHRLAMLLKNDGFLLIALPNVNGIDAGAYGENWIAYDTPRHLNHFSAKTLEQLCSRANLEVLARRQLPFDAPFNTLMSEQFSARRSGSSALAWPFRILRAGFLTALSLAGGSRIFRAEHGATLVFLFRHRRTGN